MNEIILSGRVIETPTEEKAYGYECWRITLAVVRLSGTEDYIPVLIPKYLCDMGLTEDSYIHFTASLRTYNKIENGKSKLNVLVYCESPVKVLGYKDTFNSVQLTGYVCIQPIFRSSPAGRYICELILAVDGRYYVPIIFWGRGAIAASKELSVGEAIKVVGRFQSRQYDKTLKDGTVVKKTAYEISASKFDKVEEGHEVTRRERNETI